MLKLLNTHTYICTLLLMVYKLLISYKGMHLSPLNQIILIPYMVPVTQYTPSLAGVILKRSSLFVVTFLSFVCAQIWPSSLCGVIQYSNCISLYCDPLPCQASVLK